jgi:SAM-dependent methyltransferase
VTTAAVIRVLAVAPHRVVVDPEWGYGRLDPIPSPDELDTFYESHYRDLLGRTRRGPDLVRLLGSGMEAQVERAWLAATLHADVIDAIERGTGSGIPRSVLDIGCGTGDLIRSLVDAGWDARGTEPAAEIAAAGRASGLDIAVTPAHAFLHEWRASARPGFGAVTLLNVLEHVPDPVELLRDVAGALVPGGCLVVRVPNDFSPLQAAALRTLGGDPWWVVAPDHINYFDHASLRGLAERLGFEVFEQSADYPMELFLLMGSDYRRRPRVGSAVHHKRRTLELALEPETRRRLGQAWAAAGIGRNAFLAARWPG